MNNSSHDSVKKRSGANATATDFEKFSPFKNYSDESLHISWTSLQQVYPKLSFYGGPTFILPVQLYYIIGTAKGSVLIFNKNQFVQSVLSPSLPDFRSKVTQIDINQDGTHVCAAYESGDIFLWDLNSAIDEDSNSNNIEAVLHIASHRGHSFNGLSFIPGKHTNIVVSDSTGHIVLHKGTRNHLWQLVPGAKEIMRLNPMTNPLLTMRVRSNGDDYDAEHLLAVLSSRSFAIISLSSPTVSTYRLIELTSKPSSAFGYIAWNEFNPEQVAFSIDHKLNLLDIRFPDLQWSYEGTESICKISWLTENIITVLLVSSKLLVLNISNINGDEDPVLTCIDLLVHELMIPDSAKHFAALNNKIVVLTNYCLIIGKINSWSDIVLHYIHRGDYISALGTLGYYLQASSSNSMTALLHLEKDHKKRIEQLEPSFNNLTLATVQFLLKKEGISYEKVAETASLIFDLGNAFSTEKMYDLLEQVGEALMSQHNEEFQEVLYEKILDGTVTYLSPVLFKAVMEYAVSSENDRRLETILLSLDGTSLDLDYAFRVCKQFNLYSTLLYLWTTILDDFESPLADIILFFAGKKDKCVVVDGNVEENTLFGFIESTLVGKIYPTEKRMTNEKSLLLKNDYYDLIFSGSSKIWPKGTDQKLLTCGLSTEEPAFPYASLLISSDPKKFLRILDVSFEEVLFNESPQNEFHFTRQYLIDVLLDIQDNIQNDQAKLLIALFVCRNLPKYSQFIRLTNTVIEAEIDIILNSDSNELQQTAEDCLEGLLSVYSPDTINSLIEKLSTKSFYRLRLHLYQKAGRYADYLSYMLNYDCSKIEGDHIVSGLALCERATKTSPLERNEICEILSQNFTKIVQLCRGQESLVSIIDSFDNCLHERLFEVSAPTLLLEYLKILLSGNYQLSSSFQKYARPKVLSLLYETEDLAGVTRWIGTIDVNNIEVETILQVLKEHRDSRNLIQLLVRVQNFSFAIEEINLKINELIRNENVDDLDEFLRLGISVSQKTGDSNENWVKLISNLISQYSVLTDSQKTLCDRSLQKVFIELSDRNPNDTENPEESFFWATLMEIFENKSLILSKIKDIKIVLKNIFTAYSIEETIKLLVLQVVNQSASLDITTYVNKRKEGWPIQSHDCDVCGKKIWGIGIDNSIFDRWESVRHNEKLEDKKTDVIVFTCGHSFHGSCLKNMGQRETDFKCLTCDG
ncbi:unnamed protein product [Kluyveromyces dobzhanskii CBS 2104]|uniref:WGS project CCBQ000000000 data, contig 00009 n=1 Tax=Kluyveromyces dobzhanskii CBS 2104 TaxID=1427455 RepID=A0A0A8L547_9SACH|nr:unnamed protein product [Kluyveromyces dobzhanskii CBS 2104]